MALEFRKVKRKILNGPEEGQEKYYAVAKSSGTTSLEEMCELIGARSTVSSADVKATLDSLNWVMARELKAGHVVQLGELGNFRLSLSSEGVEEEAKLTAEQIKKARIIFSPGAALRDARRKVTFTPVRVIEKVIYKDSGEEEESGGI